MLFIYVMCAILLVLVRVDGAVFRNLRDMFTSHELFQSIKGSWKFTKRHKSKGKIWKLLCLSHLKMPPLPISKKCKRMIDYISGKCVFWLYFHLYNYWERFIPWGISEVMLSLDSIYNIWKVLFWSYEIKCFCIPNLAQDANFQLLKWLLRNWEK